MSSIAPMTHRPQPAQAPDEPQVVSLQQRFADRLAERPAEAPAAKPRKKQERAADEALAALVAVGPQALRAQGAFGAAGQRVDGQAAVQQSHGQHAVPQPTGEGAHDASPTGMRDAGPALPPGRTDAHVAAPPPDAVSASVAPAGERIAHDGAPRPTSAETTDLAPSPPGVALAGEAGAARTPATHAPEPMPAPSRWPATPAPAASAQAHAGSESSSVTVAFQSWGPGHEVRAHWLPGGGVLVPGSERVGLALANAASQPGAAIAGDAWRVERADADPEQRERPRRDADQEA